MSGRPRFEVVATDAGWVARHIATAGKHTYVFETPRPFPTRHRALVAIFTIMRHTVQEGYVQGPTSFIEVRDVDERKPGLAHGTLAGVNRGCPCTPCREFFAEYRGSGVREGEAS